MPTTWNFFWKDLWNSTDFEYQGIVKISCDGLLWGLVRYSVFPLNDHQNILEVEHLESNPISRGTLDNRLVAPIGQWLMWYVSKVALQYCPCNNDDPLLILSSLETATDYYRDVIKLEYIGVAPSAPGEDLYAFRFTRDKATEFCKSHERKWGRPSRIDP
ncbi:hypothetical protein [Synechococcus sp. PCC 7502]|uniref:hypothetical protein n=1 Tax=Synechococcus sp. PCC 7502 TaxID=1173263 RepID=UPI001AEFF89A|nr:hypothetical protein [Synechococcus sp. PCC 7502]